ncbi:MAG: hypothetical protein KBT03_08885 [Bacteroidales bacterium]|nr:hypothetical protein [Candidatus Scybalousia scybalohippi]
MDIISLILSRKYTDNSIKGITGTLAGKNCTIKDITKEGAINTVEFEWTADDGTKRTSQMQVEDGAKGEDGVGIESIDKISTLGLVDTYQILYTDGNTQNFSVTNGKDGAERIRLTSDGDTIDLDGVPQTFEQIRDLIMDNTKLVTLNLWDNVAFLPSSYNGTAIWFDSGFIMNNTPTQMRVIINDQDEVKVDQIDLAKKSVVDGLTSDVEELQDFCKISKSTDNALTQSADGLYVKKSESGEPYDDTEVRGLIATNTADITSLGGRVTNTEADIVSVESDIADLELLAQDLTDNKVDKVENKSLVLNTDIEQITTNKDNIGNMNSLVVTSWTDLVSAINALYNGFMQGVSYKDKVLTITYRSGASFDINLSPIITDTNIGELSNVNDEDITNGQALVYDLASKTYKPHTFDLEQVLTDAQTYTDNQLAQHERDIAVACDEKPIYDDSGEKPIIRYKQGGEDKTTENVNTIFYYKVDQNTVQTRWISGVEFTFNVGDVDLSEYVDWDSVVETYTGEETDKTKVPNLKALDALMGIVTTQLSDKINSTDIVDNLLSDDATKVLSAKQGKELKTEVDKKVQIIRVTQEFYDQLPDDSTGKQNPSVIWRVTDSGVSVNLINDEKIENTSTWSSKKVDEEINTKANIDDITSSQGRNLIPYPYLRPNNYSHNGITYTVNNDGSITCNGTATGTAQFNLALRGLTDGGLFLKKNTKYSLSGCPNGGGVSRFRLQVTINTSEDGSESVSYQDYGSGVTFDTEDFIDTQTISVAILFTTGQVANNLTFYPMLEEGLISHSYESTVKSNATLSQEKLSQGRNLLPYPYTHGKEFTSNGITFTVGDDGSITANGTASADGDAYFNITSRTSSNWYLKAGKYTLSGNPSKDNSKIRLVIGGNSSTGTGETIAIDYGKGVTFEITEESAQRTKQVLLMIVRGETVENLTFYPQLEKGVLSHAYEPTVESNVTLAKNKVNIDDVKSLQGRNLIPYPYTTASGSTLNGITFDVNKDGGIYAHGTDVNYSARFTVTNSLKLKGGITYTISDDFGQVSARPYVYITFDNGDSDISLTSIHTKTFIPSSDTIVTIQLRAEVGWVADRTIKVMLEEGTIAHAYEPTTESNVSLKKSVDNKSLNILWSNPSPNTNFASQSITLNNNNYDYLIFQYKYRSGANYIVGSLLVTKGNGLILSYASNIADNAPVNYNRVVDYVDDTHYSFGNASAQRTNATTVATDNQWLIPLAIYGAKF